MAFLKSIDSPGGAPLEAERISFVIERLRQEHEKPVYAVIQNVGASAAYMIAVQADKVYAGRDLVDHLLAKGIPQIHRQHFRIGIKQPKII